MAVCSLYVGPAITITMAPVRFEGEGVRGRAGSRVGACEGKVAALGAGGSVSLYRVAETDW